MTFVIPPLVYSAALNSSLLAIRKDLRVVVSLSVGLVLATAVAVGAGVDLFVPGVGLAAGTALGAAVATLEVIPTAGCQVVRRARSDSNPARMIAPSARLPSGHEGTMEIRRHGQSATIMPPGACARHPFPQSA